MKNTSFSKIILILLCGCMMMASCHRKTADQTAISTNQFAKGFIISECENWTKLVVFSPWQNGQILQTYYLVRSNEIKVPNDGIRVNVPIRRISLTSCTHIKHRVSTISWMAKAAYIPCTPHWRPRIQVIRTGRASWFISVSIPAAFCLSRPCIYDLAARL